jgi:hypothetical protein
MRGEGRWNEVRVLFFQLFYYICFSPEPDITESAIPARRQLGLGAGANDTDR